MATFGSRERIIIEAINNAVRDNKRNPINIVMGTQMIDGVISSKKYTGGQASSSKPYTDIILIPKNSTNVNISLRDNNRIALYGEDRRSIEVLVPGLVSKFLRNANAELQRRGLKDGDIVPPLYGKINIRDKEKLIRGSSVTGGPIDYIYIGPNDIKYNYVKEANRLYISGELASPKQYSQEINLYISVQANKEDQRYDSKALEAGLPKIFGRSPTRGDVDNRVFLTDQILPDAILVEI